MSGADVSDDAFLGGRVRLLQPKRGYRAGIDPVLLAAAVPAKEGESVLDLGCGVGAALFCLGARVGGLDLTGLERNAGYAELARENAAKNRIEAQIVTGDVHGMPGDLRERGFDHVLTNPPYHPEGRRTRSDDEGREKSLAGVDIGQWCDAAIRRLKPGGCLTVIDDVAAFPDLLAALDARVGAVDARPLTSRADQVAKRVLVSAIKGRRREFRLHPPIVLHSGTRHERDGDDYLPEISAILRESAAFPWVAR